VTRQADDIDDRGQVIQPRPTALQYLENGLAKDWTQSVTHLAMGRVAACAIVQDDPALAQVYCWGDGLQKKDEDGVFKRLEYVTPYGELPGKVTQLSAVKDHFCALVQGSDVESSVYCWGNGLYGQLNGERLGMTLPTKVSLSGKSPIRIAAGESHSCAVVAPMNEVPGGHNVMCWGANHYRQRGILKVGISSEPQMATITIPGDNIVEDVFAGSRQTCALTRTNVESAPGMYCWGALSHGQIGREATAEVPEGFVTRPRALKAF
jgi:alpha-tubulin suppressor-like RCC1 family protein